VLSAPDRAEEALRRQGASEKPLEQRGIFLGGGMRRAPVADDDLRASARVFRRPRDDEAGRIEHLRQAPPGGPLVGSDMEPGVEFTILGALTLEQGPAERFDAA